MTTPDDRRIDPTVDDDRLLTEQMDRQASRPTTEPTTDPTTAPTTDPATGQASAPASRHAGQPADESADAPLVAAEAAVDYRSRWEVIQQGFVDDPRNAVSEADKLVDDLLKQLSDTFDRQRQGLENQWSAGEASTQDLRSALQRYRAFFQRLLTL
jgi:hypothetical protein